MAMNKIIVLFVLSIMMIPSIAQASYIEQEFNYILSSEEGDELVNYLEYTNHNFTGDEKGTILQNVMRPHEINMTLDPGIGEDIITYTFPLKFSRQQIISGIGDMIVQLPFKNADVRRIKIYQPAFSTYNLTDDMLVYDRYKRDGSNFVSMDVREDDNRTYINLTQIGLFPQLVYYFEILVRGNHKLYLIENHWSVQPPEMKINSFYYGITEYYNNIIPDINIKITENFSPHGAYYYKPKNTEEFFYFSNFYHDFTSEYKLFSYIEILSDEPINTDIYITTNKISNSFVEHTASFTESIQNYQLIEYHTISSDYVSYRTQLNVMFEEPADGWSNQLIRMQYRNETSLHYWNGSQYLWSRIQAVNTINVLPDPTSLVEDFITSFYNNDKPKMATREFVDYLYSIGLYLKDGITNFVNYLTGTKIFEVFTGTYNYIADLLKQGIEPIINAFSELVEKLSEIGSYIYNTMQRFAEITFSVITRLFEEQTIYILQNVLYTIVAVFIIIPGIMMVNRARIFIKALIRNDLITAEKNKGLKPW